MMEYEVAGRLVSTRLPYRESRFGNKVSDIQKDMHQSGSNAPMVRPLKHILGENIPPLQAGEHSKTANRKDADGSAHNQSIFGKNEVRWHTQHASCTG
ncbi:hypothetical protein OIU74_028245 [Salix koriyanagi]|uniref:Uncharacterized protein n=1 Tax=Salix koriyanagi TaxID=2511006 RepID=A0A9Q0VB62_9ROSI|nr:hypothetical protein OIU74_028245 [Salix koriyanagi]